MSQVVTLAGLAIIAAALNDAFHTVLHPGGHGAMSDALQSGVWRGFRAAARRRPGLLTIAGPTAMVATLASWAALLAVGWAFVLWPHLPDGFLVAAGLDASEERGLLDALYVSLVTLATLGYGDFAPRAGWLRILAPLEAFVGFALISAAISWILAVFPVLARRRALARQVVLLREAVPIAGVDVLHTGDDAVAALLAELTAGLVTVQGDLAQYPVTYYFHSGDARSALPIAMPDLARLAANATSPTCPPGIRLRGAMLQRAVGDFAAEVGLRFLGLTAVPVDEVLRAYAADHLYACDRVTT